MGSSFVSQARWHLLTSDDFPAYRCRSYLMGFHGFDSRLKHSSPSIRVPEDCSSSLCDTSLFEAARGRVGRCAFPSL
jgi:hypothetical protein